MWGFIENTTLRNVNTIFDLGLRIFYVLEDSDPSDIELEISYSVKNIDIDDGQRRQIRKGLVTELEELIHKEGTTNQMVIDFLSTNNDAK